MVKTQRTALRSSRLRLYVGGLAALSVAGSAQIPLPDAPGLPPRGSPRPEEGANRGEPREAPEALSAAAELIQREDWARAQRLLEEATSRSPDAELSAYLNEVRAVRRILRQLRRRPRDAALLFGVGRLYFGLELGARAEIALRRALDLEPTMADAHFYLALEYLFRGDETLARESLARAAERRPGLPTYESLLAALHGSAE